jgi:hypothetical protein
VNTLRTRREQLPNYQLEALEEIGFVWNVMDHKWKTLFVPSLQRYHQIYGHCDVPQAFVVPSNDPQWHDLETCQCYRLGSAVNKIRRGDAFTQQIEENIEELDSLGFYYNSFDRNWEERVLPALETYYHLYGHSNVETYFVIPEHDEMWPERTWNIRLGFIVQNIRSRGDFFPQIMRDAERLEAIDFIWNRAYIKWKQVILPAIETFVSIHGHSNVPRSFIVPSQAPWPIASYELRLGRIVTTSPAREKYANYIEIDHTRLLELGIDWSVFHVENMEYDDPFSLQK